MDGVVELTMIHTYIDIQICNFGGEVRQVNWTG